MNSPAIVAGAAPALEVLRVEGPQRMEALGQPVDAITVTIRRGGVEEAMLALSSVDVAACLEYAHGTRAVRTLLKRHQDELGQWTFSSADLHRLMGARIDPSNRERVWVVGPGLDLILMLSSQPKAKAFRAWLADRSLELRTKGATYASPEVRPALESESATSAALLRMTEITARLAESSMAMQERTVAMLERIDARLAEPRPLPQTRPEPPPPPPEPRFVEPEEIGDELPEGWATPSQLARRVGWFSKASKGRKPHPQAVVLAALNAGFARDPKCFAARDLVIEGSVGPRLVPQRIFTANGVSRFLSEVAPLCKGIPAFKVRPNICSQKLGYHSTYEVVRQSID